MVPVNAAGSRSKEVEQNQQINLISNFSKWLLYKRRNVSISYYLRKVYFSCQNPTFCDAKGLTRIWIWIRIDPHSFGSLDPDPHWVRKLYRIGIETNADPKHCFLALFISFLPNIFLFIKYEELKKILGLYRNFNKKIWKYFLPFRIRRSVILNYGSGSTNDYGSAHIQIGILPGHVKRIKK
jgi:hypothetical protein